MMRIYPVTLLNLHTEQFDLLHITLFLLPKSERWLLIPFIWENETLFLSCNKKKCVHSCAGREFIFHDFLEHLDYRFQIGQNKCLVVKS